MFLHGCVPMRSTPNQQLTSKEGELRTIAPGDKARDEARAKLLSTLFDDARSRAEQLAKAAGVSLGGIVGVNEYWGPSTPGVGFVSAGPFGPSTLKTAFSLSVRYAVK